MCNKIEKNKKKENSIIFYFHSIYLFSLNENSIVIFSRIYFRLFTVELGDVWIRSYMKWLYSYENNAAAAATVAITIQHKRRQQSKPK